MHAEPAEGLAGVLQQLRDRGSQARAGEGEERTQPEEHFIQKYLNAQLKTVPCLKHRETVERTPGLHKVDRALCRLARYDFLRLFSFFYISIILGGTSPHHQHLLMWRGCSPRLGDLLKTTVPECYQRTWKNCCSWEKISWSWTLSLIGTSLVSSACMVIYGINRRFSNWLIIQYHFATLVCFVRLSVCRLVCLSVGRHVSLWAVSQICNLPGWCQKYFELNQLWKAPDPHIL